MLVFVREFRCPRVLLGFHNPACCLPPFAIQMSMYEASSEAEQPYSPLCLTVGSQSLHLQVNSTISYRLLDWRKRALSGLSVWNITTVKEYFQVAILVIVYFVYTVALGIDVECCIIVWGHPDVGKACNRYCLSVCVSPAFGQRCCCPSWMFFDPPCFCSLVSVVTSLPACWNQVTNQICRPRNTHTHTQAFVRYNSCPIS